MNKIEVCGLTKDYGHGRGIFDVSLFVEDGETLGFLGPNGAGKSTTIRHLMGFSDPESGKAQIQGIDCFKHQSEILKYVGYLPGEVALPEGLNGKEFLNMMQDMRKERNEKRLDYLIHLFPVELHQNIKKMSIGEKRKLAIIAAFVNDPEILLLDEPTSGLDPLMQERFIEFIREEKQREKTILLSSHIFSEVEALCDRIEIIKDGKIISIVDAKEVKHKLRKKCILTFSNKESYEVLKESDFEILNSDKKNLTIEIIMEDLKTNDFIQLLQKCDITHYDEIPTTLEDYFMQFYKQDKTFGGVQSGRSHKSQSSNKRL